MTELDGKLALVTGGTGGIGGAICQRLAAAGAQVVTNFRNQEKAEKWQQELSKQGHEIMLFQSDVRDYASAGKMLDTIQEQTGKSVSILVNNAGITRDRRFGKMTDQQWCEVIDVNLNGSFNMSRLTVNGMVAAAWGRIINIASINGQKGQFGQANYAASKAGMHGMTMSLAQELASKGVTVNTVSPGYIATDMVMAIPEVIRNKIIADIPLRRLGTPDEVAALVCYLCTDIAGFITGADFSINGGQHMM